VATKSGSCIEQAGSPQQAAVPGSLPEGPGGDGASPGAAAVAVGVGGLAAFALVVYRWPTIKYGFVGLFTRLVKPKILDHDVRAQIHELVQSDPGIHASAVARRLELAGGQTRYHLSVLRREGLLTLVRMDGTRHYFPTGKFPPDRMRAIAALRSPANRRIYEAIRAAPGRSVKSTAEAASVAPSTVVRAAGRLARAGLVRRRRDGRTVRLEPTEAA
jgi:predicted transcriptional regulator